MAKHNRKQASYNHFDNLKAWETFSEQFEDKSVFDVSAKRVEKIASETGLSLEQAHAQVWQEYYEVRNQFDKSQISVTYAKDQSLMVRNNQLDSTCSVFQRADRIIANKPITIYLNDEQDDCPAWNDGINITVNVKAIKEITDDTVMSLHGINYHELAHILYTPRVGSDLGKWIVAKHEITKTVPHRSLQWDSNGEVMRDGNGDYLYKTEDYSYSEVDFVEPKRRVAYNILEDCRIETMLAVKYPSVRPFLVNLVSDYLAENAKQVAENFLLLAGRRYYPLDIRLMSAKAYSSKYGNDKTQAIYTIASEYRTLVFPRDYDRAKELISQLCELLPPEQDIPKGATGCSFREVPRNGRQESEKEQEKVATNDKSDENGFEAGDTKPDTDKVNKETADFAENDKELLDRLEQEIEKAKSDPEVIKKVRETSKAISKANAVKSILNKARGSKFEPSSAEVTASRLFTQELERIRIDSDPAWELERPTGKLNVRRAMNADVNEINKLFDRWTTGNDDYDVEACVLIDRSGSMFRQVGSACRSAWIIKRAVEKINGKVTTMTFSDECRVLSGRDEPAGNQPIVVEANGSTNPYYALLETERVMSITTAKTKFVIILTDGAFDSQGANDQLIKRLQSQGVYVAVAFLADEEWLTRILSNPVEVAQLSHGADTFRGISKPIDLVTVAKDVVRTVMRSANR